MARSEAGSTTNTRMTCMIVNPTEMEVVLRHLERARNVARPEQQGAPFAAPHQVAEIQEAEGDERPRQREVPVERARKPAAEPAPLRELCAVERTQEVRPPAVSEPGVGLIDLEPACDQAGEHQHGRPMGEPDDPVMAAHARSRSGSHGVWENWGHGPIPATLRASQAAPPGLSLQAG